MNPIDPLAVLSEINGELYVALRWGLTVGQEVDSYDREHVAKAAILVEQLLAAQKQKG